MDRIIKKADCKKSNFYTWVALSIGALTAGIFAIFYSVSMENYFGRNDELKALFLIIGVFFTLYSIPLFLKAYNSGQISVCICEDKLYGKAGNANFFKTIPFEINYSEIIGVTLKASMLIIEKRNEKLYFYVEDVQEVKSLIEKKMNEYIV